MSSKQAGNDPLLDGILLRGYQKKLKTMRKKYFVLYKETPNNCARLEYYDNEKKFKFGSGPKRIIKLRDCFNINRRLDTKYEYVISLSTKDGGFGLVLDTETEMQKWLEVLITLQRYDDSVCDHPRPLFEHVWQVDVQRHGLAEEKGIVGPYHACLTSKSLTFIKIGSENVPENRRVIEFLLTTIRRCGDSQCFFYMEVGRQSVIGPGELWMETEDALIAQNMHNMILSAMSSKNETNIMPMRNRSSSANEATKPISILLRKIQSENKTANATNHNGYICGRDRCDSLPSSRNRTLSDSASRILPNSMASARNIPGIRSQIINNRHSNSPPINTSISSAISKSEESSLSADEPDNYGHLMSYRFHSRSSDRVIPEERSDELQSSDKKLNEESIDKNYANKANTPMQTQSIPSATQNIPDNRKNFLSDIKHLPQHLRTMCSEYSNRLSKSGDSNNGPSYILMGPNSKDSQMKDDNTDDDYQSTENISAPRLANYGSSVERSDYPSNNVINANCTATSFSDNKSISEVPTRTYSIGSRLEHDLLKIRLNASANQEQDGANPRVRAFSVGSRAKIPRCELQRGHLNNKSVAEHASDSNSKSIRNLTEAAASRDFVGNNFPRAMKSTSVPLLIHKSQTTVDKMGDLMEIDFSKSPKNNCQRNVASPPSERICSSVPVTNQDKMEHFKTFESYNKGQSNKPAATVDAGIHVAATPAMLKQPVTTDNGYLEMKPVSFNTNQNSLCKTNNNIATSNYCDFSKTSSLSPQMGNREIINTKPNASQNRTHTLTFVSRKYDNRVNTERQRTPESSRRGTIQVKSITPKSTLKPLTTDDNEDSFSNYVNLAAVGVNNERINDNSNDLPSPVKLTSQVSPLRVIEDNMETQCSPNATSPKDNTPSPISCNDNEFANRSTTSTPKKLSATLDASPQNLNKCGLLDSSDSGYEILQIRSDSSIQSSKFYCRPISAGKADKQFFPTLQNRPSSANSGFLPAVATAALSCGCTSPASCAKKNCHALQRPASIGDNLHCFDNKLASESASTAKKLAMVAAAAVSAAQTSRPSSVTEQALHYASLDLPQCSATGIKSSPNSDSSGSTSGEPSLNSSTKSPNGAESSFTYAKINFYPAADSNASQPLKQFDSP